MESGSLKNYLLDLLYKAHYNRGLNITINFTMISSDASFLKGGEYK